jgi:hypothetical protein
MVCGVGDLLEALVDGLRELERYGLMRHGVVLRLLVWERLYRAYKDRGN